MIYATRTHSQIQEFLSEFKKTKFAKEVTAIELASRKQYCFNEKVCHLDNNYLMKQRCKEHRSSKTGCPYYNATRILNAKFELFPLKVAQTKADVSTLKLPTVPIGQPLADIEDINGYFKPKQVCSYFATKENAKFADVVFIYQVVCLPYASLLSAEARTSLGLANLSRTIVVFDEAHNITESVAAQHTIKVTADELGDVLLAH